jgi:hypothetical protein
MVAIAAASGAFLVLTGLLFLTAPVTPAGAPWTAALRNLELEGRFEKSAAILCGLMFITAGASILLNLDALG